MPTATGGNIFWMDIYYSDDVGPNVQTFFFNAQYAGCNVVYGEPTLQCYDSSIIRGMAGIPIQYDVVVNNGDQVTYDLFFTVEQLTTN